jgi:hypothetical protein
VRGRSTPCPELLIDDEEDEPPLVSDAEDDSSWTAAQGHGDDADQDEMIDDVAAERDRSWEIRRLEEQDEGIGCDRYIWRHAVSVERMNIIKGDGISSSTPRQHVPRVLISVAMPACLAYICGAACASIQTCISIRPYS